MPAVVTPLLEAKGIEKHFGAVTALAGVDFELYPGEVVAIVGDNGAGKSTFVKALNGVLTVDGGQIYIDGKAAEFHSPADALRWGIETVYQDLALASDLTASANIFLGREVTRSGLLGWAGVLDSRLMVERTEELLQQLEIVLPAANVPVSDLSGGQRQCVAIARAVAWSPKVLILDEPTAALGVAQQRVVRDLIKRVSSQHVPVILISHNMQEVLTVADRAVVFRHGRNVATFRAREATLEQLVEAITGADTNPQRW